MSASRSPRIVRRTLIATGFGVAAVTAAGPAQADTDVDSFLGALNNAGVGYTNSDVAGSLGGSVCTMLEEPGGSFARTASEVAGTDGISPDTAALFTTIAITMYCPSMISSLTTGDWWSYIPALGG